ncbi:hypothetical protein HRbin21_01311 [bacterium HR21]|nr:hypothetical protein HRbin21_01311 [bacterium HR21]
MALCFCQGSDSLLQAGKALFSAALRCTQLCNVGGEGVEEVGEFRKGLRGLDKEPLGLCKGAFEVFEPFTEWGKHIPHTFGEGFGENFCNDPRLFLGEHLSEPFVDFQQLYHA